MEKIIEFKNSFIKASRGAGAQMCDYARDSLRVRFLHEEINI